MSRLLAILIFLILSKPVLAKDWFDTFYQYRIPVTVQVEKPGWHVVPVTAAQISKAIGKLEEYSFDPTFLAYNHVRVVEATKQGPIDNPSAGFYLITSSGNLIKANPTAPIRTKKGDFYLVRFISGVRTYPPTVGYEQVFPVGEPPRTHAYMSSYVPRLLPRKKRAFECLLQSDGLDMKMSLYSCTNGGKDISVRRCEIAFIANFATTGRKKLQIYYQPMGAHYLKVPRRRRVIVPSRVARVAKIGDAQKYLSRTRYSLPGNKDIDVWFGESTVKLTRKTSPPNQSQDSIRISTAANEAQSFQLVVRAKRELDFVGLTSKDLVHKRTRVLASRVEFKEIDYVAITKRARINQVRFFGSIGDPLLPVTFRRIKRADGNVAFWVTVRTPAGTAPGKYCGQIGIHYKSGKLELPIELTVHDFQLPKFSTFHTHAGGQYLAKNSGNPKIQPVMNYHGVKSKRDLKRLARKYYEVMAKEKFYPKNVALFVEVGMKWQPPPKGYKVDAPGNFFKLVSFDFKEFNETLRHFIDELHVNSICLTHTNPSVSHIFKHLPGEPVKKFNTDPGHTTMGWQTFRKMTQVTYVKKKGDPWFATSVEVTRRQWDRLVLDYYRAMAKNLQQHGWLDKFYILIDESSGTEQILHLVRLLKSDPLTAKIRITHCLQGFECLRHQENGKYVFTKSLTYVPQIDENYYRWEKWYWDDYGVPRKRDSLWSYAAYSSRLGINVPGLTNREVGLEVFNLGGSGYVVWDTFMWHHPYGKKDDPHNPWQDPHASLANGALCYFYPPKRKGFAARPDFTITPSLRIQTYREGVDDYEYACILEDLMVKAKKRGVSTAKAQRIMRDIRRMFPGPAEWTLNDAWYIDLRERMARAIVELKRTANGR